MHSVNKTIPPKIRTKTPHKLTYHTSTPLSIGEFPAFLNRQHCMESPWFFVRVCEVSTGPNGWDVATWTLAVEWGDHLGCFLGWRWKKVDIYQTIWVWVNTYRYIFSGMNIHLPAILGFTRYQGFDPSPYGIFTSKQYGSSQHHPTSSNQNEDLANKHGDLANQKNINQF